LIEKVTVAEVEKEKLTETIEYSFLLAPKRAILDEADRNYTQD